MMAKEVIFIGDDFGINSEINDAILHSHLSGHLTGAALMMAQPGTAQAVALASENPSLQVGWHLHLNDSHPATISSWPWGDSPTRAGVAIGFSARARQLMRAEVAEQWRLFQQTGLPCRFINSHHHLHAHPLVYRALLDTVGPQFRGWIRLGKPRAFRPRGALPLWLALGWIYLNRRRRLSAWPSPDTLWGIDRGFHMNAREVESALATLPEGFHEFLFHPRTRSCPDTLCLLQLRSALAPS